MADKNNGAVKLTSLEFDISKIFQQMQELQDKLPELSKQIGEQCSKDFEVGFSNAIKNIDTSTMGKIGESFGNVFNSDKIKSATVELQNLANQYSNLAKIAVEYNEKSSKLLGNVTFDDKQGNKIVEQYEYIGDKWEKITTKQIDDIQKRQQVEQKAIEAIRKEEELAWKEYEKEQEQKSKAYEEHLKLIEKENREIQKSAEQQIKADNSAQQAKQKQEEQAWKQYEKELEQKSKIKDEERKAHEQYLKQLEKENQEILKKAEKEIKADDLAQQSKQKAISKIDELIVKYKNLIAETSKYQQTAPNKKVIDESTANVNKLQELSDKLKNNKISAKEAESQIANYNQSLKTLGSTAEKTQGFVDTMLKTIADKARWLASFYIVNSIIQSFGELGRTIKETEDAVIELQRVLNDKTLADTELSNKLYDIAFQYGRTFDEVQEVAVKFAQAGYEWNDVISLTKSTMLALNTAELDVTQSTQGLIAVMSQWKLEAADMEKIIDKINITADNYAVTSEKIVAALQRASGAAKNANISLEETIGAITALSVATGRSGENIGTALNSLIAYTSKKENLQVFAGLSEGIDEVVRQYRAGALSIYDVWVELSKELGKLTEQQQNTLAENLAMDKAYNDFAQGLESEATALTDNINSVYKTAGTFRRNYFIALLNEISTSQEAIENMTGAVGYSAEENQKYMEGLTAQLNQLGIAIKQLGVQIGEQGLLDIFKGVISLATNIAILTKNLGGIVPILNIILAYVIRIRAVAIIGKLDVLRSIVQRNVTSMLLFAQSLATAEGRARAAKLAFGSISATISTLLIGLSAVTMAVSAYNNHLEQSRQKAIEAANENQNLIDSYKGYISQLGNELNSKQDIVNIMANVKKSYADEIKTIDDINKARERGIELLNEEIKAIAERTVAETAGEAQRAKGFLGSTMYAKGSGSQKEGTGFYGTPEQVLENYKNRINELLAIQETSGELNAFQRNELEMLSSEYGKLQEQIEENKDIVERYDTALSILNGTYYETADVVDDTANRFEISEQYITGLSDAIGLLNDSIDSMQDSLDKAYGAFSEFNEQGYLSIDTIQELLSLNYEYFNVLKITENGIQLNNEAMQDLIKSQEKNLENEIKLAKEKSALAIIEKYLTEAQSENTDVTETQKQTFDATTASLKELVNAAANGVITLNELNKQLSGDKAFKGVDTKAMLAEIQDVWNGYDNLLKKSGSTIDAWSKSASKATENATKEQKRLLEEQKKAVKERYDAEIDKLKELQKERENQKKLSDLDKDIAEAESRSGVEYREKEAELRQEKEDELFKQNIEAKITQLEKLRDAEVDAIEAQINALSNGSHNVINNAVSYNGKATKQMYSDYEKNYIDPVAENTSKAYSSSVEQMSKTFGNEAEKLLDIAKLNSMQLYNIYNNNFFSKFKEQLYSIKKEFIGIGSLFSPFNANPKGQGNTTNSYNTSTTNNSNTSAYININNRNNKNNGFNIFTMQ